MQTPIEIRFHQLPTSQSLHALIADKASKLERYYDRITGCTVTVDAPNLHRHRKGKHYRVRIELAVPGGTIVVARDPQDETTYENIYAAVNKAFRTAKRQLGEFAERQRAI